MNDGMVRNYLDRIGIEKDRADAMLGGGGGGDDDNHDDDEYTPNLSDLRLLLRAHLTSIPFENLSQHVHPAAVMIDTKEKEDTCGSSDGGVNDDDAPTTTSIITEIPITNLPTLEISDTLHKIVMEHRGGFCWEINTAFAWLLRELGYAVRFGNSYPLTPCGPVPGHLCLYVDGLFEDGTSLHVDPGWGTRPPPPMLATFGMRTTTDPMLGDEYRFVRNVSNHNEDDDDDDECKDLSWKASLGQLSERFNAVLLRTRKGSPMVDITGMEGPAPQQLLDAPEPVYLLNFDDNLEVHCDEFKEGLTAVLSTDSLFAKKRMCFILREHGFDYVGTSYWKQIRNGSEVYRQTLKNEGAYRNTLEKVAGIRL